MERPSRFEATHRKLRLVRYVVVAGSTAAFGAFALVARAGHTGKSTSAGTTSSVVSQTSTYSYGDDSQSSGFDYGDSSLAPSQSSTPLVQSSGS
jgi:cytoskeletal protein RodZ